MPKRVRGVKYIFDKRNAVSVQALDNPAQSDSSQSGVSLDADESFSWLLENPPSDSESQKAHALAC